eukprot:1475330-Amphidinium_carterae.1
MVKHDSTPFSCFWRDLISGERRAKKLVHDVSGAVAIGCKAQGLNGVKCLHGLASFREAEQSGCLLGFIQLLVISGGGAVWRGCQGHSPTVQSLPVPAVQQHTRMASPVHSGARNATGWHCP